MAAPQEKTPKTATTTTEPDPAARAGSKNSLGAESVRDGRPSTDDDTEEAIDEEGPGITAAPLDDDEAGDSR